MAGRGPCPTSAVPEGDPVARNSATTHPSTGCVACSWSSSCFTTSVSVFSGAWVSINTFFVLSGFLITRLLVGNTPGPAAFGSGNSTNAVLDGSCPRCSSCSTIAGYAAFVAPSARRVLGGDILATLGYVINWRLIARADSTSAPLVAPRRCGTPGRCRSRSSSTSSFRSSLGQSSSSLGGGAARP